MGKGLIFCIAILGIFIAKAQDPWILRADPVNANDYAGVTVANGQIGIVSSPHPFQVKEIVLAGAYDQYGRGMVSNLLRGFNMLNAFVEFDGHRVGVGNATQMRQILDMQRGTFTSIWDFEDRATMSVTYRALRHLRYSTLMEVTITAKEAFEIRAGSMISAPEELQEVKNLFTEIIVQETTLPLLISTAHSPTSKLELAACNAFIFPEPAGDEPDVRHELWDNNMHHMNFTRSMDAGETYSFSIVSSQLATAHIKDPYNEAQRLTIFSALQGKSVLVEMHEAEWERLWQAGDIQIEGDAQTQQDLRNMLYHLYSFVREGSGYSLSPMGLSGLGYNGHAFWDTEIWMYPPLLVLQPKLAKSLIDYRLDRLEAAKRNASNHGYKGAMFPWESADSGEEETPVWALSGPFEHHITACVAIACWQYFSVTQDTVWLKEKGWSLLKETANFWVSRSTKHNNGSYEILNVVGADEWAENVDNDAWTNAAAKANLRFAAKAAVLLQKPLNPLWLTVAEGLIIEKFDNGITREHKSYGGEPIKQADVNLIAYPLNEITDKEKVLADLEYYKEKVPQVGTPAMTKSIFALLYARHGETEKAYETFLDGYRPNMWGPFRVVMETPRSYNPYFATAAGGILQAMMMGFGGLEITDSGIKQRQTELPKAWESLLLKGVGVEEKDFKIE